MRGDEQRADEVKIIRVFTKTGRITVKGINIVKKHRKARKERAERIIEMEAPIHHSNVMLIDPKSGKATRTRTRLDEDGTKERISIKSGDAIPRNR